MSKFKTINEADLKPSPEMIEAGVRVLADEYGVVSPYVAEELSQDVFREMMLVKLKQARCSVEKVSRPS